MICKMINSDKIVFNLETPEHDKLEIQCSTLSDAINTMENFCSELRDPSFTAALSNNPEDSSYMHLYTEDEVLFIEFFYKNEDDQNVLIGHIRYGLEDNGYPYIVLEPEMATLLLEYAVNSTYGEFNT